MDNIIKKNVTQKFLLRNKMPNIIKYYINHISPSQDISLWKALFLGKKLPCYYNPSLHFISPIKYKKWFFRKPCKKSLQLDITSFCNLSCPNCDRSIKQAPCRDYMSLQQIEKFVDESIKLNWEWQAIHVLGGEPTLHPNFFEVLNILKQYKDINPNCIIEIWTNGFGEKVNKILSKLPNWVGLSNSHKNPQIMPKFNSYNIAPFDLKKYKNSDFTKGCWITEICGIGLTGYGYYPCDAGAAVDRVFGFDIGIKKLSDLTDSKLRHQMCILCRYCGHYKEPAKSLIQEEEMSESWIKAYENYRKNKPVLSLY